MSRRPRWPTRVFPARSKPLRAPTQLAHDTEELMSNSRVKSKETETETVHPHLQSHPKLSPASQPAPHHDYSVHEITNAPAPIPDTGLPPPSADTTTAVAPPVSSSQTPGTSRVPPHSHVASKSAFVPLPSLKTLNFTEMDEEAARLSLAAHPTSTGLQSVATTPATSGAHDRTYPPNTSHLSTTAIVALAVGGGLTFLVIAVLVKLIKRPRRRKTPTPSLPILHDGFPNDKAESEGSPLFGGKERSSPTPQERAAKGNTGIWTWTQYNSGIPKPLPTLTVTRSSSQNQMPVVNQVTQGGGVAAVDNDAVHIQGQRPGQYPFAGHGNSDAILKTKSSAPLQPVQNAITRAVSRLSTVSMSLYPNSPSGYSQAGGDVGLAIDGVAHNEPANVTAPNRTTPFRNRISMIAPGSCAKDTAELRRSQSFAYGGMEPTSPPAACPNRVQLGSGRARIKSTYYTPGSYPRASTAANFSKHSIEHDSIPLGENRVERTDSRRGRELTSALGLVSPAPPSPQPTLYPDDSMSMIGEAKKITVTGRSQKKAVPKAGSHCDSPPSDTAALGSLMMVDFAVSKSTASLVNIRPCEAARAREVAGKSSLKKRVEDKPPRVPSPPPIPSLAQMALQHADPEGYADYHSPTYSIYGLYDGDRKSRGLSYGY